MLKKIALSTVMLTAFGWAAHASEPRNFSIPAGDLAPALESLARQTGLELVFQPADLLGIRTQGLKGKLSPEEAVSKLISGTPLTMTTDPAGAILIAIPHGAASNAATDENARYVQIAQAHAANTSAGKDEAEASSRASTATIQEVIVTAQKREERLKDVPVPVTALSADTLVSSNQRRLEDYYARVPGLSLTLIGDQSAPLLSIRGITTGGATNPTVAILIDDVPYGSSTVEGANSVAPDIDPIDLARVEVLRGPQGTLYGASSLGGLIKYVTVDPTTEGIKAVVRAGTSSVRNGDRLGYEASGSINVPFGDTVAVRASAFTRGDPGYIDNVDTGQNGVNKAHAYGGRVAALWRPSDDFSLKLSALLQNSTTDGSSAVYAKPGLGDLQQDTLRGTGGYDKKVQSYTATVAAKLGNVDFTSISGYSIDKIQTDLDGTPLFGPLLGINLLPQSLFGITGFSDVSPAKTDKFTQEIRFSESIGDRFDWLVGGFYTHESVQQGLDIRAADLNTGATVGTWYHSDIPTTYAEYAAFADLTVHFTSQFDVQFGGRESHNKQTHSSVLTGPLVPIFYGPAPLVSPEVQSKDNAFTYLVTPRFKVSPDLMLYARLASGYRPGGPNVSVGAFSNLPKTYSADKTLNYELGAKGDFLDHKLSLDASVYYISWKDVQLLLLDKTTFTSYNSNGGRAKSQGVELSIEARPLTGLTVSSWVAWNDAELTESFPPTAGASGADGARLPYSSRFSGNFSVDQEFPIASDVTGFAGAMVSYVGNRVGVFQATPARQIFPAYAKTDLRGGVKYDTWTANLFVNNLTDRRGMLRGGLDSFVPYAFYYIQPRTIGVSVSKTFGR